MQAHNAQALRKSLNFTVQEGSFTVIVPAEISGPIGNHSGINRDTDTGGGTEVFEA